MAIESNQPTRRDILKLGAAAVGVPIATRPTTSTSTRATSVPRELLRDRHFQHGFLLLDPKQGKRVVYGRLPGIASANQPAWDLAQWSSRFPIQPDHPEHLPGGGLRFANESKSITVGRPGSEYADLSLGVTATAEYGSRARKPDEPWVHLLVSQEIPDPPSLGDVSAVESHLAARLKHSRHVRTPEYSPDVHAAHIQVFLSIQNRKPGAGFGDYLWFGLPIYDDRFRMPPAYKEQDTADTKKFIYTCAAADIATESTHDHKWVKFDRDLQPLIRRAMETAWSRGFLTFSRRIADYHIAGFFLGWEVPGIFDVEVQVRDLCLRV